MALSAREIHNQQPNPRNPMKVIIDTDPGIDDAIAILMAFNSPEVEVIGITTVFGNCTTQVATRNALHLCEVAGYHDMAVAEGHCRPLKGGDPRLSEIAHGRDGLGNTSPPEPKQAKVAMNAADFLVQKMKEFPNQITILALGPLTNVADAILKDKSFARNVKKIFVLGGSFLASGNINPAAEANVYFDPEAADLIFTSGADVTVIGINLTTRIVLTDSDILDIRDSKSRHGDYIYNMCIFYKDLKALIEPSLFTYKRGVVRVETQGLCTGHTLVDLGMKKWNGSNPWCSQPQINVGWTVNAQGVVALVKERLMKD